MKIQPPSRKEQIREILIREGKALIVDKLVRLSGIPADKIRQTLTTWEFNIVRVGSKTFDLAERVYVGKTFRYSPSKIEVENGILQAEDDLHLFLVAFHDFSAEITLIDGENKTHKLKRNLTSQKYPFPYFSGLSSWFRRSSLEYGDDIVLSCLNLKEYKFEITRQKKEDRDEFQITVKNKKTG